VRHPPSHVSEQSVGSVAATFSLLSAPPAGMAEAEPNPPTLRKAMVGNAVLTTKLRKSLLVFFAPFRLSETLTGLSDWFFFIEIEYDGCSMTVRRGTVFYGLFSAAIARKWLLTVHFPGLIAVVAGIIPDFLPRTVTHGTHLFAASSATAAGILPLPVASGTHLSLFARTVATCTSFAIYFTGAVAGTAIDGDCARTETGTAGLVTGAVATRTIFIAVITKCAILGFGYPSFTVTHGTIALLSRKGAGNHCHCTKNQQDNNFFHHAFRISH
jgi:hypothetical protein